MSDNTKIVVSTFETKENIWIRMIVYINNCAIGRDELKTNQYEITFVL